MHGRMIALDLETTGLDPASDEIIEIGAVALDNGVIGRTFQTLINPGMPIPELVVNLTGISDEDVRDAPPVGDVLQALADFVGDAPLIAHNATFDRAFLHRQDVLLGNAFFDTLAIADILLPQVERLNLGALTHTFEVDLKGSHRALADATATARLYWLFWQHALSLPKELLSELSALRADGNWPEQSFFTAAHANTERAEAKTLPLPHPTPPDMPGLHTTIDDTTRRLVCSATDIIARGDRQFVEANYPTSINGLRELALAHLNGQENGTLIIACDADIVDRLAADIEAHAGSDTASTVSALHAPDQYLNPQDLRDQFLVKWRSTARWRVLAKLLVHLSSSGSTHIAGVRLRHTDGATWRSASGVASPNGGHADDSDRAAPLSNALKSAEQASVIVLSYEAITSDDLGMNALFQTSASVVTRDALALSEVMRAANTFSIGQTSFIALFEELEDILTSLLDRYQEDPAIMLKTRTRDRFESTMREGSKAALDQGIRFFEACAQFALTQASQADIQYGNPVWLSQATRHGADYGRWVEAWLATEPYLDAMIEMANQLVQPAESGKTIASQTAALIRVLQSTIARFERVHSGLRGFVLSPEQNQHYAIRRYEKAGETTLVSQSARAGDGLSQRRWTRARASILMAASDQPAISGFLAPELGAESFAFPQDGTGIQSHLLAGLPTNVPEPNDHGFQRTLERVLIEIAAQMRGRYLVLFTSYRQQLTTAEAIRPRLALGGNALFDQGSGYSNQTLLKQLDTVSDGFLFGGRGFWGESAVPVNLVDGTIIVRVPFPAPNDRLSASPSQQERNRFTTFDLPYAAYRMRRAISNAVGSNSKAGVVLILDKRIASKGYGPFLGDAVPCSQFITAAWEDLLPQLTDWASPTMATSGEHT
jgi:ATP-dependent DNA helicase DinG